MKHLRRTALILASVLFAAMLSACVVPDGGYGYYDGGADIGLDYYEPDGAVYGGWDTGYQVGPFYGGRHRPDGDGHRPDGDGHRPDGDGHRPDGGSHPQPPAYRPAPESHPLPSIPTRPRPRGSRPR
jgi:hypothetical protein